MIIKYRDNPYAPYHQHDTDAFFYTLTDALSREGVLTGWNEGHKQGLARVFGGIVEALLQQDTVTVLPMSIHSTVVAKFTREHLCSLVGIEVPDYLKA